ncbi:MAG: response regulator [Archangiaceae bacterium]|nr:response regulator [Archangiaceae bacterium]
MAIVLVIEDDEQVRRVTERLLVRRGHDVIAAKNGHDALRRTSHCTPDLIITDIYMPECDGFEVITLLRSTSSDVRIIAMSAGHIHGLDVLGVAGRLGAQVQLPKPFTEAQLLAAVDEALAPLERRTG